MADSLEISDDEILLRRIPPTCAKDRGDGYCRPNSDRLLPPPDHEGASCNCLLLVSPRDLLDALRAQHKDPCGWMVAAIPVRDVKKLGLRVVATPGDLPGHCEIRPPAGTPVKRGPFTRLAKKSRILTDDEISSLKAGDTVDL